MARHGGPKRPNKIIALRREKVEIRMATGATLISIANELRVPYRTIKNDAREIRKKDKQEEDAKKAKWLIARRLLIVEEECKKLIDKEIEDAAQGRKKVTLGIPLVRRRRKGDPTPGELMAAATNELIPIEEVTETLLPRIRGIASLEKVRVEALKVIAGIYGFSERTREIYTKETEKTLIAGFAVIADKAESSKVWEQLATAYADQGKTIEVKAEATDE